jgi:transformation/transcription domain-associated protein
MMTLMLERCPHELVPFRKELIRFSWIHLKNDNTISKYWAYVAVARFIDVYDPPSKIVIQVYVALLRAHQPECRGLVRKALDILTPSLAKVRSHTSAGALRLMRGTAPHSACLWATSSPRG